MQDRYGKSARQKDAHICLSQELLFSRKYDLESERKSVNGHRLSIGIKAVTLLAAGRMDIAESSNNASLIYRLPKAVLYLHLLTYLYIHTYYLCSMFLPRCPFSYKNDNDIHDIMNHVVS